MSTTTPSVQKTAELTDEQLEIIDTDADPVYNVVNHSHDDVKEHTYSVIANGHGEALSCTCPHQKYRSAFCKHMAAVEEFVRNSVATDGADASECTEETIVGPFVEPADQGGLTYYRCECCNRESLTRETVHNGVEA